ncbi:glycosyl transferase 2 family protein [Neisseria meningitidis M7124]|nr:glycosyl transferase 2 family protein [Neisseria meningitidis M7124]
MNLSIVVPIYNVESYLEACLSSIEPILSNENVELILVNDGSKAEVKIYVINIIR